MSDAVFWNEIGNIYLKIGSHEEAIAAYTKAIELNPDSGWLYCNLGHVYFLTGNFSRALVLFQKSICFMDTPENQAVVWNKIGDAYRALKDIDNAIRAYKKADALDMRALPPEQSTDTQSAGGANLRDTLETEKSIPNTNNPLSALIKAASPSELSFENPALADGFQPVNVGKRCEEIHVQSELTETKPSISSTPNRIPGQDIDALSVENNQNTARLVPDAENNSLLRKKPIIVIPDPDEITGTSMNEEIASSNPEPIRNSTATRVDEIRDGKSKDHSNKCPSVGNLEEILAKVNVYENITRVNPTNDRAWDTLGKLYKSLGRYKDAIGAYQKAIEMAPDREVYFYYLGLLYSVEQRNDEAVKAFQFVLRKNPDYILAHSAIAGVYHRLGLENKANHHIATALPKMNNESTYNRACFYAICGDTELAFEFLRLALMNNDTTIEWIKSDPDLDPIRTDPRYLELISGINQPAPKDAKGNYFSSELEGTQNRLLPILNHSLAR